MVGFPTFELPTLPPHRVLSPFNEVPEDMGGSDCQIMVDGLMQNCSLATANNTRNWGQAFESSILFDLRVVFP